MRVKYAFMTTDTVFYVPVYGAQVIRFMIKKRKKEVGRIYMQQLFMCALIHGSLFAISYVCSKTYLLCTATQCRPIAMIRQFCADKYKRPSKHRPILLTIFSVHIRLNDYSVKRMTMPNVICTF